MKFKINMLKLCLCLVGVFAEQTFAATLFVRAGATGSRNGSDWNNAYPSLPTNLVRGNTYYIAGGSYGDITLNDAVVGTALIALKKATVADHGSSTGWQDSYGSTQAVFTSFSILKSDYTIDGQTGGGPGSWEAGFGFKIQMPVSGAQSSAINFGGNVVSNLTFRHIDIQGRGRSYTGGDTDLFYIVNSYSNLTISYCFMHDTDRTMILSWPAGGSGFVVEYSKFARNGTDEHREAWSAGTDSNVSIRYNLFEDILGTGVIAIVNNSGTAANWDIYGNAFYWTGQYSDGIINTGMIFNRYDGTCTGSAVCVVASNWHVYNNIFANIRNGSFTAAVSSQKSTNYVVENNIWINNQATDIGADGVTTADYNYFYGNGAAGVAGAHDVAGTGSPFVDATPWTTGNWALKAPLKGLTLAAPYNLDWLGHTRGVDGVWDIGALEYSVSTPTAVNPPTNFKVLSKKVGP